MVWIAISANVVGSMYDENKDEAIEDRILNGLSLSLPFSCMFVCYLFIACVPAYLSTCCRYLFTCLIA